MRTRRDQASTSSSDRQTDFEYRHCCEKYAPIDMGEDTSTFLPSYVKSQALEESNKGQPRSLP